MANPFFERPIVNSPYEYPRQHWELDESGQPTGNLIDRRRRAEFTASVTDIEPGEYECQLTVLDPGSGRAAFWRTTIVVVR